MGISLVSPLLSVMVAVSAISGALEPRRILLSLPPLADSEMRLSSLTKDSPHHALSRFSKGSSEKGAFAYLVYLLTYLASFW